MADTNRSRRSASKLPIPIADRIKIVWSEDFEREFGNMCAVARKYRYIVVSSLHPACMDTPSKPCRKISNRSFYHMFMNVDATNTVQLGITFFNNDGSLPATEKYVTWQFNFHCDKKVEKYSEENLEMFERIGVNLGKHRFEGIDAKAFKARMLKKGRGLKSHIWVAYCGMYDYAYLMKLCSKHELKPRIEIFRTMMDEMCSEAYDVEYLLRYYCPCLQGGLHEVAEQLQIDTYGTKFHAGSNSIKTGMIFFKLLEKYFRNGSFAIYNGKFYGIDTTVTSK